MLGLCSRSASILPSIALTDFNRRPIALELVSIAAIALTPTKANTAASQKSESESSTPALLMDRVRYGGRLGQPH